MNQSIDFRKTFQTDEPGFLPGIFSGGAKSIVMQISFVMLLFSGQISRRGKSFRGGKLPQGGAPLPPVEESQELLYGDYKKITSFQNPVQKIPMISQSQNNIFSFTNYKHSLLPGKRILLYRQNSILLASVYQKLDVWTSKHWVQSDVHFI